MQHLAMEFGVSWHTIYRDVQYLLEDYPIVVSQGKGGGISLPRGYYISQRHLSKKQADTIRRCLPILQANDREILESILLEFE